MRIVFKHNNTDPKRFGYALRQDRERGARSRLRCKLLGVSGPNDPALAKKFREYSQARLTTTPKSRAAEKSAFDRYLDEIAELFRS
jgi:hypothetical protein